jgi:hypothetical protein
VGTSGSGQRRRRRRRRRQGRARLCRSEANEGSCSRVFDGHWAVIGDFQKDSAHPAFERVYAIMKGCNAGSCTHAHGRNGLRQGDAHHSSVTDRAHPANGNALSTSFSDKPTSLTSRRQRQLRQDLSLPRQQWTRRTRRWRSTSRTARPCRPSGKTTMRSALLQHHAHSSQNYHTAPALQQPRIVTPPHSPRALRP